MLELTPNDLTNAVQTAMRLPAGAPPPIDPQHPPVTIHHLIYDVYDHIAGQAVYYQRIAGSTYATITIRPEAFTGWNGHLQLPANDLPGLITALDKLQAEVTAYLASQEEPNPCP